MPNNADPETLLSVMDQAAEALIALVKDNDPTKALTERPTVGEKIKAFEALTDYMKYREKPQGTAPTTNKFKDLREKFNGGGDKTKGRGGRTARADSDEDDDDSTSGSVN